MIMVITTVKLFMLYMMIVLITTIALSTMITVIMMSMAITRRMLIITSMSCASSAKRASATVAKRATNKQDEGHLLGTAQISRPAITTAKPPRAYMLLCGARAGLARLHSCVYNKLRPYRDITRHHDHYGCCVDVHHQPLSKTRGGGINEPTHMMIDLTRRSSARIVGEPSRAMAVTEISYISRNISPNDRHVMSQMTNMIARSN